MVTSFIQLRAQVSFVQVKREQYAEKSSYSETLHEYLNELQQTNIASFQY